MSIFGVNALESMAEVTVTEGLQFGVFASSAGTAQCTEFRFW